MTFYRNTQRIELDIIRHHRKWTHKLLIRLFPHAFNTFAVQHLSRAHEKGEVGNDLLHHLLWYVGADCNLPGYKEAK